ncbi:MAG: Arc family DNA-binding protein [Treponema sp.]|jgi:hypothetical protein|nr:Arc family DNA-binding protein [Treponema sp.]
MSEQDNAAVGDGASGDKKKQIPLRLSYSLWVELAAWADAEFRSVNGQIEYLLNECVKTRRKNKMENKE